MRSGPWRTPERNIGEVLARPLGAVCGVFGVTGAGLMLIDEQSGLRYVAATDEAAAVLEQVQEQAGAGPCVESFVNDTEIAVPTSPTTTAGRPSPSPCWPPASARCSASRRASAAARSDAERLRRRSRDWDESEREAIRSFNTSLRRRSHRPSRCTTTAAWSSSCSTHSTTASRSSGRSAC